MNALFATGHMSIWILVFGLFFPRLTLFIAWFMMAYPVNTLSVLLNFVLWLLLPRFLLAFYIYTDIGPNNVWFWAYLVTGFLGFFGESGVVHRRVRRRRVIRNGNTVTRVNEEEA